MAAETKKCQNCKNDFTIESEDFQFYDRIKVPPPTFCPECRLQRRMAFRNERTLYKDICDLCGKSFVSMYSPDKPFTVYCKECWYSDNWDPLQHGMDYDWNKPFFAQFRKLMLKVPRIGVMHIHTNMNSDYANYIADVKNVYLSGSVIAGSENVYHSRNVDKSKEIFDCFNIKESERCYENVDTARNYRVKFAVRSRNCIDSAFLFDCVNCQNCFMSSNLRNRQYVIRNVQSTKEGYAAAMGELRKSSAIISLCEEFTAVMRESLHKYGNLTKIVNCTGNNIDNSKNTEHSFDVYDSENVKYCVRVVGGKDLCDVSWAVLCELEYEVLAGGYNTRNSQFTDHSEAANESQYVNWCQNSMNLFGCVGLRKRQYCILNKQYTQEEYEKLKAKIIAHMNEMPYVSKKRQATSDKEVKYRYGEFFPTELSPFAYNETIAQEYFPLTKEKVEAKGYAWREPDPSPYTPTIAATQLPDDIQSVENSVTNEIIGCACGKVYRIVKPELEFLKKEGIALPQKCQECRHKARFALRNPLELWKRRCTCNAGTRDMRQGTGEYGNTTHHFHGDAPCPNEFETSYAPDRPEVVYCETCYQMEIG